MKRIDYGLYTRGWGWESNDKTKESVMRAKLNYVAKIKENIQRKKLTRNQLSPSGLPSRILDEILLGSCSMDMDSLIRLDNFVAQQ